MKDPFDTAFSEKDKLEAKKMRAWGYPLCSIRELTGVDFTVNRRVISPFSPEFQPISEQDMRDEKLQRRI
jgi:hypothetical protein